MSEQRTAERPQTVFVDLAIRGMPPSQARNVLATQSRLCRDVGRCANRLPCSRLTMDPPFGSPLSLKPHPRVPACYGTPRHDAHVRSSPAFEE